MPASSSRLALDKQLACAEATFAVNKHCMGTYRFDADGTCKQVRYCSRSCQEADWDTHQHFCQSLKSQEIQQAFQDEMEKCGPEKSGLQPFIASMRAELGSAVKAGDDLKAGFAHLFLSGALHALDPDSFEAEACLMCAADAGKEIGDWKLEQQALTGLMAQRKQWDINGAGATAVGKLLGRSLIKKDVFAQQLAVTHCGILQTYTDLLSGPYCNDETKAMFESGIGFFHQSIEIMFDLQRDACKWVEHFPEPHAAAGAARMMHMVNFGQDITKCPHVALSWMEQGRHDNLVQLYRANMNKGDREAAAAVLGALDYACSGPEHAAYVKACIANGNEAFDFLHLLEDIRVIVLRGQGKNFCGGMDLSSFDDIARPPDQSCPARRAIKLRQDTMKWQGAFNAMERCRWPVLAAVHGACIGAGVDMITACDIRYCTEDARFCVKEVDRAMAADMGTLQRLPSIVGQGHARHLSLTGATIDGREAHRIGLANVTFQDASRLWSGVEAAAADIATKSPIALVGTKRMLLYSRDHTVADGLDYVATWNAGILYSEDMPEMIQALKEKRRPVFAKL
ncbi:hypothetical protein WJX84_010877 [Apatococcus fuscideae]|uniref:MYND-type domain-containing protein n=1 Tax=Apatococcus fuscideae TaxID=2026836 RepID=A0AAW1TIU8_9CHLO